jgi:hypothetical protein
MNDEAEVAERLKQNIPKPDANGTSDRVDDANRPPEDTGYTSDLGDVPDIYKLYDFFGVESNYRNTDNERKLQEVYRWAADRVESTDYLQVAKAIMDSEQSMGGSTIGSRLDRMYQYVKLDQQIKRLKAEQSWI